MSNEALTWAFKQELPMVEKFMLVSLADYADEEFSCYPSYNKTARRVGCSRRTVMRGISSLIERGYVRVISRERPNGSASSNRYVLSVGVVTHSHQGGDRESPGVVSDSHQGGDSVSPLEPSLEPSPKPSQEPPAPGGAVARAPERRAVPAKKNGGEYTPEFLEWWKHYPRKTDKGNAFKAWQKLDGVDVQTLINGADRYAADPNREARFTKHPATWLNARSWEDEDPLPARGSHSWYPSHEERMDDGMDMVRMAQQMQAEQDRKELT